MDPKELRGLMEAYAEVYAPQEVDEAVKGASPHTMQMRKDAAAERKAGAKDRLSPSKGKQNAEKMQRDIKYFDKITKKTKPSVVGMTHEEVESVDELYKGKHGQSETEYQDSRSNAGKMVSGTSKLSGAAYSSRGVKNTGPNPAGGSQKPQAQGRMTSGQRTELQYRKANLMKKEELEIFDVVLEFLQVEGYAETLEEAEWLMANVIDEEAIDIILGEAEGSYGQTPKARTAMGKLSIDRMRKPASEYSERGEKTKKVKSAEKHYNRMSNPDAGNRGKKSTKSRYPAGRQGFKMTQKDRDYSRGEAEYGHTGYDPDFDGGPSGPGGKPKGKKAERQKKTGVSAEAFDYVNEAQEARNNPEKYEREQSKKSAPVRGEKTPMPPRGDKRREDFEKWYAANVR
jgi:hypothetical protein